jgi:AcrR family transcriptional regulator
VTKNGAAQRASRPATAAQNAKLRQEGEFEHRHVHILSAAERIFGTKPYDEASMQDVAREAGTGMKGLYAHFKSKEELFAEVVSYRLAEIEARLKASREIADPIVRLDELGKTYAAFFAEHPQFCAVFALQKVSADWGLESRFADAASSIRKVEAEVVKAMQAGIDAGVLTPVEPELLAAVALGFFLTATQFRLLKNPSAPPEVIASLLFNGIRKVNP